MTDVQNLSSQRYEYQRLPAISYRQNAGFFL